MTSIAVTASMCASAAEVALLVASFMPVLSLNLGATYRGAVMRNDCQNFTRNTPRRASPDESPLGEVDCVTVEQHYGGNLTPVSPGTDTVLSK